MPTRFQEWDLGDLPNKPEKGSVCEFCSHPQASSSVSMKGDLFVM